MQFVQMYHPLIPSTADDPVWVSINAVDDYEAKGWVLVDGELPPPPPPFTTAEMVALRAAFGALDGGNTWTGTQDFTGATVTGIAGGGSADLSLLAARVEDFGSTVGTGGDDYAALQAAIDYGIANRVPVIAAGTYLTSAELVAAGDSFVMYGHGAKRSTITRTTAGTVLTVRKATATADQGDALTGHVRDLSLIGATSLPTDGSVGLRLDNMRGFRVYDVLTDKVDIGFDAINNCYGSSWHGCRSIANQVNVGLLLRGSRPDGSGAIAGSGSDNTMVDCWFGGTAAALWLEPNAGGYHFWGGQLAGGNGLSGTRDDLGSVVSGTFYQATTTVATAASAGATSLILTDGTKVYPSGRLRVGTQEIEYAGVSGNTLTGVTGLTTTATVGTAVYPCGAVSNVNFVGVSWEGTSKRHEVRGYDSMTDFTFTASCSMHGGLGNTPLSVIKSSRVNSMSSIVMSGLKVDGTFANSTLLDFADFGSMLIEDGTTGVAVANGVTQDYRLRPLIAWGGVKHGQARYGLGQQYHRVSDQGRYTRLTASGFETTTTDTDQAWSALGQSGALGWIEAEDRFTRANSANLGTSPSGFLWDDGSGGWAISGNKAVSTYTDATAVHGGTVTGSRDVAVDVTLVNTSSSFQIQPVFLDGNNNIRVFVAQNFGQAFCKVGGVETQVGINFSAGFGADMAGRMEVRYRTSGFLEVLIDGASIYQAHMTETQRAAMNAAPSYVLLRAGSPLGSTMDNFSIRR